MVLISTLFRVAQHFANTKNYRVVVVDAQTFLIPNFTYDGQAPDAHFWVGEGTRPGPEVSLTWLHLEKKSNSQKSG